MTAGWIGGRIAMLGAALVIGAPVGSRVAEAARSGGHRSHSAASSSHVRAIQAGMYHAHGQRTGRGYSAGYYGYSYGGGLQCVPFARENSGIELSGNAGTWWSNAEGTYERGSRPEVGSVLNFRATGRMRMGHVAVVSRVVDSRNVEIDHANWSGRGAITRNVSLVDVSERNDWTAVRVALGRGGDYGSIYPTYGFIYDRPDRGTMVANNGAAPAPLLNPAPRDLRPSVERYSLSVVPAEAEEVAEAAEDVQPRVHRVSGRRGYVHRGGVVLVRGPVSASRAAATPRAMVVKVHSRASGPVAAAPRRGRHRL